MTRESGPWIAGDSARHFENVLFEWNHDLRSQLAAISLSIEIALSRVPKRGRRTKEFRPLLEQARAIVKETVLLMDDFLTQRLDLRSPQRRE